MIIIERRVSWKVWCLIRCNLVFAGSVSHPQTDEYIPLVVTVSNFGDVSIKRDNQMDTNSTQDQQSQDNQVTDKDGV